MATIITAENLPRFRNLYNKAVKEKQTQFIFDGQEVLVSFAKYLIEYSETQIKTSRHEQSEAQI
jgi:hypothetical protein